MPPFSPQTPHPLPFLVQEQNKLCFNAAHFVPTPQPPPLLQAKNWKEQIFTHFRLFREWPKWRDLDPHLEFKPHKSCCSCFNFLPFRHPSTFSCYNFNRSLPPLPPIYIYILTSWDRRSSKYYHKRSLELKVKLNYKQKIKLLLF